MAKSFHYSPTTRGLYPVALKGRYESAGSWPTDGFLVDDEIAQEFQADTARGHNEETGYLGKEIVKTENGFAIVEVKE